MFYSIKLYFFIFKVILAKCTGVAVGSGSKKELVLLVCLIELLL